MSLLISLTQSILLPLLLVVTLIIIIIKTKNINNGNSLLPPSPPRLPILGNLYQLLKRGVVLHQTLNQLSKQYGPIMLMKLGFMPIVVISSPELAREALKVHDLDCCSRPPSFGSSILTYNYLDLAFSPYSEYWKEMRKLCVLELFSSKKVHSFRFVREEEVASLINLITEHISRNGPTTSINITQMLYSYTASLSFRIAFGKRFPGSEFDNQKLKELVDEAETIVGCFSPSDYIPYLGRVIDRITGHQRKIDRVFAELDKFFEQVIDGHINHDNPDRIGPVRHDSCQVCHDQVKHENPDRTEQVWEDIIYVLLRIEKRWGDSPGSVQISKENIKAILLNLFLGGIDTSALTLNWAMTELMRNPSVLKKAQTELRAAIKTNKTIIAEDDIARLTYFKNVVKETMRLHPALPLLIPRQVMSHFKLNNYDINPKTLILVNAWAIGRDSKYWKHPERFLPERFEGSSIDYMGQDFEYLPFGSGRRSCPGIKMGTVTVEVALANLLYRFDWQLPGGLSVERVSVEEAPGLSCSRKENLELVPVRYCFE